MQTHGWNVTYKFTKTGQGPEWTLYLCRNEHNAVIITGPQNFLWQFGEHGLSWCGRQKQILNMLLQIIAVKYVWARLENENLKDKRKSELASSSEFYFLKYHLKRLWVYTNDATITETILGNAHLKLPSEPVGKVLKTLMIAFCGHFVFAHPNSVHTLTIHLPDS